MESKNNDEREDNEDEAKEPNDTGTKRYQSHHTKFQWLKFLKLFILHSFHYCQGIIKFKKLCGITSLFVRSNTGYDVLLFMLFFDQRNLFHLNATRSKFLQPYLCFMHM